MVDNFTKHTCREYVFKKTTFAFFHNFFFMSQEIPASETPADYEPVHHPPPYPDDTVVIVDINTETNSAPVEIETSTVVDKNATPMETVEKNATEIVEKNATETVEKNASAVSHKSKKMKHTTH